MAVGQAYATVPELESFWRELTNDEETRAAYLLVLASDYLRQVAINNGKDLDQMLADGKVLSNCDGVSEACHAYTS